MMRPRGTPPTPMAASKLSDVVEIAGISETSRSPSRIIDPLPNFFSIFANAASIALPRSALNRSSAMAYISFFAPLLILHRLVLPQRAERIAHSGREWNSVSHLQQPVFLEGEVRKQLASQPPLRFREIVRASITQISLIQCARKFSDLLREIRCPIEPLHLSDDRRSDNNCVGITLHIPHLLDIRNPEPNRDRKRREPAHASHKLLCFGADSLTRSRYASSRNGVNKTARVFGNYFQTFIGRSRRHQEDHLEVVRT